MACASLAAVLTLAAAAAAPTPGWAEVPDPIATLQQDLPRNLVIMYRADPQNRVAFETFLKTQQAAKLRKLRADGKIGDFRIIFSWYAQSALWDAVVQIRFDNNRQLAAWNSLEQTAPGGLSPAGLKLGHPSLTVSADMAWTAGAAKDRNSEDSVYYVIPYEYRDTEEYVRYAQAYIIPQYDGWLKAGVLSGYDVLMNRFAVGESWDVLVMFQYRDLDAFGRRQKTLEAVRRGLADNAEWQAYHKRKADIRVESENSIGTLIAR